VCQGKQVQMKSGGNKKTGKAGKATTKVEEKSNWKQKSKNLHIYLTHSLRLRLWPQVNIYLCVRKI